MHYIILTGVALLALFATACQQDAPTPPLARTATPAPSPTQMLAATPRPGAVIMPTPTPRPRPTPTQRPTATPRPAPTAARSPTFGGSASTTPSPLPEVAVLLQQSQAAMSRVRTYHMVGSVLAKPTQENAEALVQATFEGTGEVDGNYQVLFRVKMHIEDVVMEVPFEFRAINGSAYLKNPFTGEWEVAPAGDVSTVFGNLGEVGQVWSSDLNPKDFRVANDVTDGIPVYRVSGHAEENGLVMDIQLWIDRESQLVRRVRTESLAPASDYGSIVPGNVVQMYEVADTRLDRFNEPVNIEGVEVKSPPTVSL